MPEARAPASVVVAAELVATTIEAAAEAPVPAAVGTLVAGEAVGDASVEGASLEPAAEL